MVMSLWPSFFGPPCTREKVTVPSVTSTEASHCCPFLALSLHVSCSADWPNMSKTVTFCQKASGEFRNGHGTMDMIFTARQLQEQCHEQAVRPVCSACGSNQSLRCSKQGCAMEDLEENWLSYSDLVDIIRLFHDGTQVCVIEALVWFGLSRV